MNGAVVMHSEKRTDIRRAVKAVIIGAAAGICISMLVILVCALIAVKSGTVPYNAVPYITGAAQGIGALCGGYICARAFRRMGMALGAVCGCLEGTVLFVIGLLSGGAAAWAALIRLLISAVCGAAGGVAGVNKRSRRK